MHAEEKGNVEEEEWRRGEEGAFKSYEDYDDEISLLITPFDYRFAVLACFLCLLANFGTSGLVWLVG